MTTSPEAPALEVTDIAGTPYQVQLVGDEIPDLPDGYHFSREPLRYDIRVPRLINANYPLDEFGRTVYDEEHWAYMSRTLMARRRYLIDVGVEGPDDELAGFGRVILWPTHGELSDFVVGERHRRQGLGTAIIIARHRLALKAGITSLHIDPLLHSNDRQKIYRMLGYAQDEDEGWSYSQSEPRRQAVFYS